MIIYQYQQAIKYSGQPISLPKTIVRDNIANKKTDELIIKYLGQHDTTKFREEFLNTTVNGKSTVRLAESLGLIIDKIEVVADGRNRQGKHYHKAPKLFSVF